MALSLARLHRASLSTLAGPLDRLATCGPDRDQTRSAVVWTGPALAGADGGNLAYGDVGAICSGLVALDLGSSSGPPTSGGVRLAHAGSSHISRQQESWLEAGSQPSGRSCASGSLALDAVPGTGGITPLAASGLHHGRRPRFDRHDRRDQGIFRLGQLWLLDILPRAPDAPTLLRCLPLQRQGATGRFALRF